MTEHIVTRNTMALILFVAGCLAVGLLSGMTASTSDGYQGLELPPLSPPGILFPIAWTVLYILMGVSLWLVYRAGGDRTFYVLFAAQLVLNFIWVPLFFGADLMLPAFVDLIFLWAAVAMMIRRCVSVDIRAGYLLIPYIIWLTFAGYLNLGTFLLNRGCRLGCDREPGSERCRIPGGHMHAMTSS